MYVTTSRKPSNSTKILANNIACYLNSKYEPRGKKSLEQLMARATELGYNRIIVVSETKGNPNKLAFIDAKEEKWIFPFIIFSVKTEDLKKKIKPLKKEVELIVKNNNENNTQIERIAKLFDIPHPTTDDTVNFIIKKDSLIFKYKDKKLVLRIKDLLESKAAEETNE